MTLVVVTLGRLAEVVDVFVVLFTFEISEEVVVIGFGMVFPNKIEVSFALAGVGVAKKVFPDGTLTLALVVAKVNVVKLLLGDPTVGIEDTGFCDSEVEENTNCVALGLDSDVTPGEHF